MTKWGRVQDARDAGQCSCTRVDGAGSPRHRGGAKDLTCGGQITDGREEE
jgi:hypothetical protein